LNTESKSRSRNRRTIRVNITDPIPAKRLEARGVALSWCAFDEQQRGRTPVLCVRLLRGES
jgi:hypothetical protein